MPSIINYSHEVSEKVELVYLDNLRHEIFNFKTLNLLLGPLYFIKSFCCRLQNSLGGGLGIFTDRDQQSIFWVFNFENLSFAGYWSLVLYF